MALEKITKMDNDLPQEAIYALTETLNAPTLDYSTKLKVAGVLVKIGKVDGILAPIIIQTLTTYFFTLTSNDSVRWIVVEALGRIGEIRNILHSDFIKELINILNDPNSSNYGKSMTAKALGKIAQGGRVFTPKVTIALINVLNDRNLMSHVISNAAFALGEITRRNGYLLSEAICALTDVLIDPILDDIFAQIGVTDALAEIAKRDDLEGIEFLNKMCNVKNNLELKNNNNVFNRIVKTLGFISPIAFVQMITDNDSCVLIQDICHMVGKAFIIHSEKIFISDTRHQVSIPCPESVDPRKITPIGPRALPALSRSSHDAPALNSGFPPSSTPRDAARSCD